jgi:ribosome modulation factor
MKTKLLLFFAFISLTMGAQTTHQLGWGNTGSDANQQLTIEVGDTVEWTWGSGTHNLVSTSGVETFDSGYESSGFVWSHTFTVVGSTDYVCSPHAGNMYGTITTTEAAPSSDLALQGILDLNIVDDGYGVNGSQGKAIHVLATADIADLSIYGIGVANNGGGTDGEEYNFESTASATAGDNILVVRSVEAMNAYMDASTIFDQVILGSSSISQNGNDAIELYLNGTIVEVFGDADVNPDTFGAGCGDDVNCWDYEDSWAYKIGGEWTYGGVNCSDGTATTWDSTCVYPLAIGQEPVTFTPPTWAGDWVLDPVAGALAVGPTATDLGWWSSSAGDVDTRACLFDDIYRFNADGSYEQVMQDQTWLEGWQEGQDGEGCGTPIAPHNGSNAATYTYTDTSVTVIGDGAFMGLAKVHNTGEDGVSGGEITYNVVSVDENYMVVNIAYGAGYWQFMFRNAAYTPPAEPTTDVTFTVNTANIEVGANGMYLGGGIIGNATAHAMTDADGDGTWEVTVTLDEGTAGNYIFLNSPNDGGDWGAKEDLGGQECGDPDNYNDRILAPVGADDYTLQHCFGNCYIDGTCGPVGPCDSALALTPGTTQTGNTSEWGDLFDDSSCLGSYDGGDDALFMYTATEDGETLDVTVSGQAGWSGVAMSQGCPTEGGEVCVGSQTSSGSDPLNFTSDPLIAGEVYYIHISTWPSPQTTDFILDTAVIAAPSCLTPTGLTASDVTPTGATLSWVSDGTAFMVELQPAGSAQGTAGGYVIGDVENLTTTSVTIPEGSLAPSTSYDFFVVNICGEGDLSEYAGPSTFNTLLEGPGCGETLSYDYPTGTSGGSGFATNFTAANSADLLFTSTVDNAGDLLTLDIGGSTENNYDWVYVTDGAGNVLLAPVSGTLSESVASEDGTVNVYLASDTSVTSGPVTFTVSCEPQSFTPPTWAGDWYIDPTAGALAVGPNADDLGWWSSSADDVTTRACLFDDIYRFGADGTFENILGDQTWLEGWQEGQEGEGCGTPIAPHDGSNPATYSYTDNSVTVSGSGAFLGLAKVHNTGEDGAPVDDTITYEVISVDDTYMTVHINFGPGVWAFRFINSTALGIEDVNPVSNFNFYPNPVNDMLTIKAQASIDSITVYNMLGQAVVRSTPNTTDSTVDMSALQTGAYFVQVSINNTLKTVRVIKN